MILYHLPDANQVCRNFVALYWPNPGTPGSQVKSMYERLAAADDVLLGKDNATKDSGMKTNGQVQAVKSEGS